MNAAKSDRIPTPDLIGSCVGRVIHAWQHYHEYFGDRFVRDAYTGLDLEEGESFRKAVEALKFKSEYLIREENDQIEVKEGAVIYKLHKYRERDTKIIKKKKEKEFIRLGKLPCEACTFDFFQKYGKLGYKYIECHHRTPLAEFSSTTRTTLDDLALVCSNCHRMLHRRVDTLSVEGLRQMLTA